MVLAAGKKEVQIVRPSHVIKEYAHRDPTFNCAFRLHTKILFRFMQQVDDLSRQAMRELHKDLDATTAELRKRERVRSSKGKTSDVSHRNKNPISIAAIERMVSQFLVSTFV